LPVGDLRRGRFYVCDALLNGHLSGRIGGRPGKRRLLRSMTAVQSVFI
jgi:hypothetical protein